MSELAKKFLNDEVSLEEFCDRQEQELGERVLISKQKLMDLLSSRRDEIEAEIVDTDRGATKPLILSVRVPVSRDDIQEKGEIDVESLVRTERLFLPPNPEGWERLKQIDISDLETDEARNFAQTAVDEEGVPPNEGVWGIFEARVFGELPEDRADIAGNRRTGKVQLMTFPRGNIVAIFIGGGVKKQFDSIRGKSNRDMAERGLDKLVERF